MKIKIHSKLKSKAFLITLPVLFVLCLLLGNEVIRVRTETEEQAVVSYTGRPAINYEVGVVQNEIYEGSKLPEGEIYISSYISNIYASFSHLIDTTVVADIKGSYSVKAKIESRTGSTAESGLLWSKEYELVSEKEFNEKSTDFSLQEDIIINYNKYNAISQELKALTEISSYDVLIISMPINYAVVTPSGVIAEQMEPRMVIPLDQRYFAVEKLEVAEKSSDITETVISKIPVNKMTVTTVSILILLLIIANVVLYFFTVPYTSQDLYVKSIKKIFREYEQRLVGVKNSVEFKDENNRVKSIEDLIKISDELNKPIIYTYRENLSEVSSFYVFDHDVMYTYTVKYSEEPK